MGGRGDASPARISAPFGATLRTGAPSTEEQCRESLSATEMGLAALVPKGVEMFCPPPGAMNQQCRVCGEPAAGFHFGAFTCEGCKFVLRATYNNVSSRSGVQERRPLRHQQETGQRARPAACASACSSHVQERIRYGRRSNWFKIHCLLEDRRSSAAGELGGSGASGCWGGPGTSDDEGDPIDVCGPPEVPRGSPPPARTSPALSSPDSHASDNSVEASLKEASLAAPVGVALKAAAPPSDVPMDLSVRSSAASPPDAGADHDILDLSLKTRQDPKEEVESAEPEKENSHETPERPTASAPGVAVGMGGSCALTPLNLALHLQPRARSVS
ncbi:nuclear hormone receptor FTZ-F1-like [Penaeus monodon]|uniref:nuclear hormone receptor FTZ-F1-like n=1 Tax=Penaeus monodon TaxID=6687 RepID=UPI0018A73393|nr:nuclear hormone receptor FTZ-F1-like [Penaeus monodon]